MCKTKLSFIIAMLFALSSCEDLIPEAPAENELLDGPTDGLTHGEQLQFLKGDIAFNDEVFSSTNGL